MFYFYIVFSKKLNRYYLGHTADLIKRLDEHNIGLSVFTSKVSDWILVYSEPFATRELARNREFEVKRKKSRKYIEWLISQTP